MTTGAKPGDPKAGGPATVEGRRVAAGAKPLDDFTYFIVETPAAPARPPVAGKTAPKNAGQPSGERRGESRLRTRLRDGVLAEGRGRIVGDCRIRDRSKDGARLQLDKDMVLPKVFLLTDPASRTRFKATLIWQEAREAGVKLAPLA